MNGARNAVERLKSVKENIVVNSIESRRQTKKGHDSLIAIIQSTKNIVSNFEWSRLSAVAWTVSRVGRAEKIMGVQVG